MFRKRNISFLVTLLIALFFIGIFSIYSYIKKFYPAGYLKTISMGLEFKELNDEMSSQKVMPAKGEMDVLHYDIKIELETSKKNINGDVTITLLLNNPGIKTIPINFCKNLFIKNLTLNGNPASYNQEEKLLIVENNAEMKDTAKIRVQYSGTPKSLGFGSFTFETHENHPFVYTMNEPVYASTWLPCVDIPTDKALMDMFVTNDSCCVSLSNGKLVDIKINGSEKTYHWKTFYPISTYLIAIYSGQYKSYSQKYFSIMKEPIELTYYAFPDNLENVKKDCEDHPDYLAVFEKLFGPYPFAKEKYSVAEFLWQAGAMEHQTLTGIGSNFMSGRKFFKDILIHELAHHWWGNAVGPKTWKDIWLNEGFATYSEALYWEKAAGFSALQSTLAAKRNSFADGILHEPGNSLFSRLVYDKGAWVLHMLRREVGDEVFFRILKHYFSMYKYRNASTGDFKSLCETLSGKNLKFFFDQWVYQGEGRIELEYKWEVIKQDNYELVTIEIEQVQNGYELYKFPLDIRLVFGEDETETKSIYVNNIRQKFTFTAEKSPVNIQLDPEKWLLADFELVDN